MIRALRCMSPKTPLGRLRSGGALCIFRSCRMAVKRRICGRLSIFCDRIFTVSLEIRRKNRRCFRVGFAVLCCGFWLLLLFRRLRGIAEINIFTDESRHDLDVFSLQNFSDFCVKIDAFLLRILRIALTFSASNAHANTPFTTFFSIKNTSKSSKFSRGACLRHAVISKEKTESAHPHYSKNCKGSSRFS